jgi:hypothetical protein
MTGKFIEGAGACELAEEGIEFRGVEVVDCDATRKAGASD